MDTKLSSEEELQVVKRLLSWERAMPRPGLEKKVSGSQFENSQMMRLQFLLTEIGKRRGGSKFYEPLASMTTGERGKQYLGRDIYSFGSPLPLSDDWCLEGQMSLEQKLELLRHLHKFNWSPTFVRCAEDFVSGKSVSEYA